jgi:hypothetical protein
MIKWIPNMPIHPLSSIMLKESPIFPKRTTNFSQKVFECMRKNSCGPIGP